MEPPHTIIMCSLKIIYFMYMELCTSNTSFLILKTLLVVLANGYHTLAEPGGGGLAGVMPPYP
jgi:hypothetical protein